MSSRKPTREEVMPLMKAAGSGDVATLQHLLQDNKMDINTCGPSYHPWYERTPLLVAASNGKYDAVMKLLDLRANIHAMDEDGQTVLHCAARGGNPSVVDHFINAGLDMNAVSNDGVTVLHCAAMGGNPSVVDRFIKAGLDVNAADSIGRTVLHCAAIGGNPSVVDRFINAGLDLNAVSKYKSTPLHAASINGHAGVVEILLRKGATTVNQTDKDGNTPLGLAVKYGRRSVVWTIIKSYKADISQYDEGTKQKISELLAVEEENRKVQQNQSTSTDLSHEVLNEIFKESTLPSPDVRVAMMGTEGSGKTCLGDTLTGQTFKDTSPTEGADEMEIVVKSAIDWSLQSKEEMISNLQQQVLQEVKHSTEERSQSAEDFKASTTKSASNASLAPSSHLQKAKSNIPSLPMFELPGGDKMYILTTEEFKQLPSMLEKYDPLRRYVNIWDYAGQHVFQHTHGLFVSEEVVCLIVFDASKLLDEVPERRYKDDTSPARSGLDTISYWMDLISCRVSKKSTSDSDLSEFLPTFILVGTKIDLLSPDIIKAEQIALQKFVPMLKKNLAGKPFAKHIAGSKNGQLFTPGSPSIFFLSNCNRNVKVVAELQRVILQAAPMKSRPTRLVKMERKLMLLSHEEKLSVVDMEQIKEVAKSCGISSDHEGILRVLKFFHQKGTLLYFHQVPALSNVIILCPQWLAKLLTYVLTNLICQPAGPPLAQYAKERNDKGLLRQQLLNFCIDMFLTEESRKGFKVPKLKGDDVVDLLLKFKLMADVTDSSLATTKTSSKDRIFLVPHLLPIKQFTPATGPCYKVFYLFRGEFIPDNLVDQLIVKCAEWNKKQKFGFLRVAYQWISMKLGLHQSYQLRPIHKSDLIELIILSNPMMPPEEEKIALTNSNELITVVKTFIDELMQESMTVTFEQYPVECYLPCPACSEVHVELEKIRQNISDVCPTSNEFIDMTKYHKMLTHNMEQDIVTSSTENTAAIKLLSSQLQEAASSEDTQQMIQQTQLSTAVTAKDEDLTLDQDSVNIKTAMDYIRKEYKNLIHLRISTDAMRDLYMEQVITLKEKKEIQRKETEDRMEYLLDDVIIPSLQANSALKYIKLIRVMKRSDDILIKSVASELTLHLYS